MRDCILDCIRVLQNVLEVSSEDLVVLSSFCAIESGHYFFLLKDGDIVRLGCCGCSSLLTQLPRDARVNVGSDCMQHRPQRKNGSFIYQQIA